MEVVIRSDAGAAAPNSWHGSSPLACVPSLTSCWASPLAARWSASMTTSRRCIGTPASISRAAAPSTSMSISAFPTEDEHSYRHYMDRHLFSRVNIVPANTQIPNGMAVDLRAEADRYERLIQEAGGIDLQLLGIGEAGHIGFNEPLSALMSRTREKALTPVTRQQNASMFGGDADQVPARALTMGVGTILEARELILLATGRAKAAILAKAVEGPITAMISASALQLHPNCKVVVDEEAAADLAQLEYYDWVFRNEPEWRDYQG